ncbi:hypothetical protein FRC11_014106 [Ceratobasidium sp. 423]|nr:hypothetical protein FRC11_014106 [Ceratobasidium sp. 423]
MTDSPAKPNVLARKTSRIPATTNRILCSHSRSVADFRPAILANYESIACDKKSKTNDGSTQSIISAGTDSIDDRPRKASANTSPANIILPPGSNSSEVAEVIKASAYADAPSLPSTQLMSNTVITSTTQRELFEARQEANDSKAPSTISSSQFSEWPDTKPAYMPAKSLETHIKSLPKAPSERSGSATPTFEGPACIPSSSANSVKAKDYNQVFGSQAHTLINQMYNKRDCAIKDIIDIINDLECLTEEAKTSNEIYKLIYTTNRELSKNLSALQAEEERFRLILANASALKADEDDISEDDISEFASDRGSTYGNDYPDDSMEVDPQEVERLNQEITHPWKAQWDTNPNETNTWNTDPAETHNPLELIFATLKRLEQDNKDIKEHMIRMELGKPSLPIQPPRPQPNPPKFDTATQIQGMQLGPSTGSPVGRVQQAAQPTMPTQPKQNMVVQLTETTVPTPAPTAPAVTSYASATGQGGSKPIIPAPVKGTIAQMLKNAAAVPTGSSPSNIKYIAKFSTHPLETPGPTILVPKMRSALDNAGRTLGHGRLVTTKWSEKGNLTLEFTSNSSRDAIKAAAPILMGVLCVPDFTFEPQEPLTKVVVSNVPTGINYCGTTYGKEYLKERLTESHPYFKNLKLFLEPDWIVNPLRLQNEGHLSSAIAFTFIDPGKTQSAKLLEQSWISINGHRCQIKPSTSKPTLQSCTNCAHYGHTSDICISPLRCNHCGGKHKSSEHTNTNCEGCPKAGTNHPSNSCKCVWCPSCNKPGHKFRADDCPKLNEFRRPITSILTHAAPAL